MTQSLFCFLGLCVAYVLTQYAIGFIHALYRTKARREGSGIDSGVAMSMYQDQ